MPNAAPTSAAMVVALADTGALRLPTRDAVDLLWALGTSDLYLRLRRTGRWSATRADAQIEDLLARILFALISRGPRAEPRQFGSPAPQLTEVPSPGEWSSMLMPGLRVQRSRVMTVNDVALLAVLVFAWAVLSGVLARRNVTGPLVFAAAGYALGNPGWGPIHLDLDSSTIHLIAEVTLALLLYADASRVNLQELRRDKSVPLRLLGIGFPLSVLAGAILAAALFDMPWGLAAFLGAALAPTDAALSLQVINDARIPLRLRRSLNVESGLNDGIATPVVSVALAVAASQLGVVGHSVTFELVSEIRALGVGLAIGAATGILGALAIGYAGQRHWIAPGGRRVSALALALVSFTTALAADGNGFIAAFVAGAAFGAVANREVIDLEHVIELPELLGEVLSLVVWFMFGAAVLPIAFAHASVQIALYTVLSLTFVRMVPVALSMFRSGLDRPSTLFVAWFGPRGLASIVFAILAVEELGESQSAVVTAIATIAATVAASVLLHGVTAGPGAVGYIRHEQSSVLEGPRARHSSFRHVRGSGPPDARRDQPRAVRAGDLVTTERSETSLERKGGAGWTFAAVDLEPDDLPLVEEFVDQRSASGRRWRALAHSVRRRRVSEVSGAMGWVSRTSTRTQVSRTMTSTLGALPA